LINPITPVMRMTSATGATNGDRRRIGTSSTSPINTHAHTGNAHFVTDGIESAYAQAKAASTSSGKNDATRLRAKSDYSQALKRYTAALMQQTRPDTRQEMIRTSLRRQSTLGRTCGQCGLSPTLEQNSLSVCASCEEIFEQELEKLRTDLAAAKEQLDQASAIAVDLGNEHRDGA